LFLHRFVVHSFFLCQWWCEYL